MALPGQTNFKVQPFSQSCIKGTYTLHYLNSFNQTGLKIVYQRRRHPVPMIIILDKDDKHTVFGLRRLDLKCNFIRLLFLGCSNINQDLKTWLEDCLKFALALCLLYNAILNRRLKIKSSRQVKNEQKNED